MSSPHGVCRVCERDFEVRFRYQVREEAGAFVYVCSMVCQQRLLSGACDAPSASGHADNQGGGAAAEPSCVCDVCSRSFALEYPFQAAVTDGERRYFCSTECRAAEAERRETGSGLIAPPRVARRIAVFNHKGGTGKTTTSVNLAAGLAEAGYKVLLVDADGQGNVGASLGIRGEKNLYHVLVHGLPPEEASIPVRQGLDVITSNESLAAAELHLAQRTGRDRVLRERLGTLGDAYDVVVLDCAPALSLMNQNALVYADSVIVPVSCDYLSLVGVKQVLKTLRNVRELLKHDVDIVGVLPTFYDSRNRVARDAVDALRKHFGDKCLPPIRVNTRLREAPTAKQSIFEYDPECNGAIDYRQLVQHVMTATERPAHGDPAGFHGMAASA
jgi:chromosome partitioning protein